MKASIKLNVRAKEKLASVVKGKEGQSSVSIEVTLLDANDNNPVFVPNNLYEFMVSSDAKIGDVVGVVKAVDPDLGRNGVVFYDIQRSASNSRYVLNKTFNKCLCNTFLILIIFKIYMNFIKTHISFVVLLEINSFN